MRKVAGLFVCAAVIAGCAAPAQELRYDLANPGLPYDKDRTVVYRAAPDEALLAARTALAGNGFRVGEESRSQRGTWFTAYHAITAAGLDASTGVGVLVKPDAPGYVRVSVVSRSSDSPATIHTWIARELKSPQ